jgi:hydroxyacid-oxoacid transhydrogenase
MQHNRALVGSSGGGGGGGGPASAADVSEAREYAYEIKASSFKYGPGVIRELGHDARSMRMSKVVVFTDATVRALPFFAAAIAALKSTVSSVLVFDEVAVEPTDRSCEAAAAFLTDAIGRDACDGVISIGGGSVMDTLKIANLLAVHGGRILDWTNAPIGAGRIPDRALLPHIAVPTTCGTGAEQTGLAIYDLVAIGAKTGVGNSAIKPDRAVIDPEAVYSLPAGVIAASGFDTLSHSIESYTARPYTARPLPRDRVRPAAQGATPFTDIGCLAALEIVGVHLPQAVLGDRAALERMVFASTLAGTAINGAGCTAPHALSYSISSLNKQLKWQPRKGAGWPAAPIVPHGFAVALTAPACFRHNASTNPERHLRCARLLDPRNEHNTRDATPDQAGEALRLAVVAMMRRNKMPSGLAEIGYGEAHMNDLVKGALPQRRLLDNNPRPLDAASIAQIYRESFNVF